MAGKTIQNDILDTADAIGAIGIGKEGCPAVSCAIGIDGIATASGLEIADTDMADGGDNGQNPHAGVAIFSGNIFERNVFDWAAFEVEIFETNERIVGVEGYQIVVCLSFGDGGDIPHPSVAAVAAEVKSILVEGDSIALEANVAKIEVVDPAHPDIVGYGIGDGNVSQGETIDLVEIENGAAPCVWIEEILGLCVARALVIAVPNAAPNPDFFVSFLVIGIGQEKVASFFGGVSAQKEYRILVGQDLRMRVHPERCDNPVFSGRNFDTPCTGIEGLLNGGRIIGKAIADGTEFHYICGFENHGKGRKEVGKSV